jgi:hypothetical protein
MTPLPTRLEAIAVGMQCRKANFDGVRDPWQKPFDCTIIYKGTDGFDQSFTVNLDMAKDYSQAAGSIREKRDQGILVPPLWGFQNDDDREERKP